MLLRNVLLLGGQPVGPVGLGSLGIGSGRSGSYQAETQLHQYRTSRLRSREKKAERWKRGMRMDLGRTAGNVLSYDLGGSSNSSVGGELYIANSDQNSYQFWSLSHIAG
jgi:hypothetical protein